MLSKNPKLAVERLLIFGALGLYLYKYIKLQKVGQLAGEPPMMVKLDKSKMFDMASKHFGMGEAQRQVMEGLYDSVMKEEDNG